ncbi:MAG TPA: DUF177 domain-containing protein [Xanthobacteraceae bacterium]|nr:DUF177 domain-containing protein [Xanthobacteraceae bacterium]
MTKIADNPWKVPVRIDEIPESGKKIELEADATIRATLARLANINGLPRLHASFDLTRHKRDGVHVVGRVTATADQTCIVTLEPITNEVDEAIDLVFAPGDQRPEKEIVASAEDEDPPELILNGVVDLGAIAAEFLVLGIDPYPRKSDAVFERPVEDESAENPFAALAALKKSDPSPGT